MSYQEELNEVLKAILQRITSLGEKLSLLENQYQGLRREKSTSAEVTSKPQFHSLQKIEDFAQEELGKREILNDKLKEAAELAILDYRKNPPRRRK